MGIVKLFVVVSVALVSPAYSEVNWSDGTISVTNAVAADLTAPSAKVARIRACRIAEEQAFVGLAKEIKRMKKAKGVSLDFELHKQHLSKIAQISAKYSSDGSCQKTVRVPVASLRMLALGSSSQTETVELRVQGGKKYGKPRLGLKFKGLPDSSHVSEVYWRSKVKKSKAEGQLKSWNKKAGVVVIGLKSGVEKSLKNKRVVLYIYGR